MSWSRLMSWLVPNRVPRDKVAHLDAAVAGAVKSSNRSSRVANALISRSIRSQERLGAVAVETSSRIEKQEERRLARLAAERERGVVDAIEDLLQLPGFGGRDSD